MKVKVIKDPSATMVFVRAAKAMKVKAMKPTHAMKAVRAMKDMKPTNAMKDTNAMKAMKVKCWRATKAKNATRAIKAAMKELRALSPQGHGDIGKVVLWLGAIAEICDGLGRCELPQ